MPRDSGLMDVSVAVQAREDPVQGAIRKQWLSNFPRQIVAAVNRVAYLRLCGRTECVTWFCLRLRFSCKCRKCTEQTGRDLRKLRKCKLIGRVARRVVVPVPIERCVCDHQSAIALAPERPVVTP